MVISGAIAGLVSRYFQGSVPSSHIHTTDTTASFCIAPLDVIKIRLQLQSHSLSDPLSHHPPTHHGPIYKGTLSTFQTILREEGLTGLWKGNIPAEFLYLAYGSVQFLAYRSATQALNNFFGSDVHDNPRLPGHVTSFVAGATAGTAATTVTYPLDLLRTRFAAQGTERVYASLRASVRDIREHEGWRGLFRGLTAGVGQIVPYMGLFFSLYESFKPMFVGTHLPLAGMGSGDAIAGIMASVLSKTAVFPLDTVRKRLQVQGPTRGRYVHRNIPTYDKGVLGTIAAIVKKEGTKGLYRGLPVSLIKAAPASAVTVWTYERVMHMLKELDEEMQAN